MKRIIIFFTMSLLFTLGVNAQTLSTDTYNDANSNLPLVGSNFDVPVDVTGIGTIYTLTVYFEYDNTALTYSGFANSVPNSFVSHVAPNIIKVLVGDFPNQSTIPDGKLIDLQFTYNGGYSNLEFGITPVDTYKSEILLLTWSKFFFLASDVTNGAVEGYWDNTIDGGDWHTASDWSLNVVPDATHNVTVAAGTETSVDAAAAANNVSIQQGGQLTLNDALMAGGDFMIESNASGSGSFVNNGTLTVTGMSSAQCYVTNGQWHGISSPVSGEDFSAMYLGGSPKVWIREFDEANGVYDNMDDTTQLMGDMQGWFTWIQTSGSPQTFMFDGAFRTGTIGTANNMTHDGAGHNFVGNPFTSAIDWDAASGWMKTNLHDAIYVYNGTSFDSYVGGVGTGDGSQYIAMSQGFFVEVAGPGTGTLTMDADVAVHNAVPYYKAAAAEQQIVRLQITDGVSTDETVVRFTDEATIAYDSYFDAHKLMPIDNNEATLIYSTANDFMSINSLPFAEMIEIPMDVKGADGISMTISATEAEDFEKLYLTDNLTGEQVNLKNGAYSFTYDISTSDRFMLAFGTLGVNDNELSDAANIFAYDKNIQVVLDGIDHANIAVYNLLGQVVATSSTNSNVTRIPMDKTGYYLVKVSNDTNVVTKKVFIK